jgi:FkbM family methyltransferase
MVVNSFPNLARRFYRWYRNGAIRIGHSLVRRGLGLCIAKEQEVQLRSGLKMALDMTKGNQAGIFWDDGDAEVHLSWAIRELVPLAGLFVDCGANCGLMGLLARQYRRARVIFFEPHPRLARTVETNIRLNNFAEQCELIEAAVSDTSGSIVFYEHSQADGSHSMHADWAKELEGELRPIGKVRCVTLREIVEEKKLGRIDFLKIDTEGNDYAVLKGLGEYLAPSFLSVICMEMCRDREATIELMQARGYTGYVPAVKRRHDTHRLQRLYEAGGRVSFFKPLVPAGEPEEVVLWCGTGSPTEVYLKELSSAAHDSGI